MFFTVPDTDNRPVMINYKNIESITFVEGLDELTMSINLVSGSFVLTKMPRQVLVQMLNNMSEKPTPVQTHTEFAG